METTLHRQLKTLYSTANSRTEAKLGSFRVDLDCGTFVVEIQPGRLVAIRRKLWQLLKATRVLVVKPVIANKLIVRLQGPNGPIVGTRRSPKHGTLHELFDELVYMTSVFPSERLLLDVPVIDIEEHRYPKPRSRWGTNYQVVDRRLLDVQTVVRLYSGADLLRLLPCRLPQVFDTAQLAGLVGCPRWFAQKIAYCLRKLGVISVLGKKGNALVYRPLPEEHPEPPSWPNLPSPRQIKKGLRRAKRIDGRKVATRKAA